MATSQSFGGLRNQLGTPGFVTQFANTDGAAWMSFSVKDLDPPMEIAFEGSAGDGVWSPLFFQNIDTLNFTTGTASNGNFQGSIDGISIIRWQTSAQGSTPCSIEGRTYEFPLIQPTSIQSAGFTSVVNSTNTPLGASSTWNGEWEVVEGWPSLTVGAKSDVDGTIYIEFSSDAITADFTSTLNTLGGARETHRFSVSAKYFRVRYTNGTTPQGYLKLQSIIGFQTLLNSPVNSVIGSDADSITTRTIDYNFLLSSGLIAGQSPTIKEGYNEDIDMGSVPEDITNEGGPYAGFPTGATQLGQILVSGADTGTVWYSYLESEISTSYTMASKAVAGAGTYRLTHNIYRSNFAFFVGTSSTSANVGDITIRNTPTTANVFCVIPAGIGQTYCAAYTVPKDCAIYIDRFSGSLRGSVSGSLDGFMWYRPFGESPRLRFSFELQFGALYFDDVDYLIRVPERVDMVPRIVATSANNLHAKYIWRFVLVKLYV